METLKYSSACPSGEYLLYPSSIMADNYGWKFIYNYFVETTTNESKSPCSSLSTSNSVDFTVDKCRCCGNIIKVLNSTLTYRCVICNTAMNNNRNHLANSEDVNMSCVSIEIIKSISNACLQKFYENFEVDKQKALNSFKDLEDYLYKCFTNYLILNNSCFATPDRQISPKTANICPEKIFQIFNYLLSLPIKKPFFVLLVACNNLLHNPPNIEKPESLRWLLILSEIPSLPYSLHFNNNSPSNNINGSNTTPNITKKSNLFFESSEVKNISFKILERIIGILANLNENCMKYLTNWFSNYTEPIFVRNVNLLNLYITFNLRLISYKNDQMQHPTYQANTNTRISSNINNVNNRQMHRNNPSCNSPEIPYDNKHDTENQQRPKSFFESLANMLTFQPEPRRKYINIPKKLMVIEYGENWNLKTSCQVLSLFFQANKKLKLPNTIFYNTMVDYTINIKNDFDVWQSLTSDSLHNYIYSVINSSSMISNNKPMFTFCQFPFILSISLKIMALEYESKKKMTNKAEEAFLIALNNRIFMDVYCKFKIRREHIINDSLTNIKNNLNNLHKSLKIEFINEPGIDVGGLKKEWFSLLIEKLFNPNNGLFYNVDESNFLWFTISDIDKNEGIKNNNSNEDNEHYYLFGVILGLAIYNSIILDLKFPKLIYKILLNVKLNFEDFLELYPERADNLKKIIEYNQEDFDAVFEEITFEINYKDKYNELKSWKLIPEGDKTNITKENVKIYLEKYYMFFLNDSISTKLKYFKDGFKQVINNNSITLFSPGEIQLIINGENNGEKKIDLKTLKSVTKYNNFLSTNVPILEWFWDFFENLSVEDEKKLLFFVTGSSRIPATGVSNLKFTITKAGSDSDSLPLAHTCFNEVCLFEYSSREKFETKMYLAINESEGFGIK